MKFFVRQWKENAFDVVLLTSDDDRVIATYKTKEKAESRLPQDAADYLDSLIVKYENKILKYKEKQNKLFRR